ncbi:metalloregulator ArsR/SmtB family transcription factor [Thermococcus sp.]|uniref:ArsR/SmtB family transcription factor n=1 Tax=Thermococcus sp. TaxID=35749 RepID=UPI00262D4164|nr:metalloregulator ArsR/SmtB family transcription factor [Thermococcus sp.]
MRVADLLSELDEKQRRTVLECGRECGIPDLDAEINARIDDNVVKFLKALSNPIRLRILKLLMNNWLCVCLISRALNREQTLISHHLRTLRSLGLIKVKKVGKMHFYRTDAKALRNYLDRVHRELMLE